VIARVIADFNIARRDIAGHVAQEGPKEVGDFLVLLHSGFSRRPALVYKHVYRLGSGGGGLIGYWAHGQSQHVGLPYAKGRGGGSPSPSFFGGAGGWGRGGRGVDGAGSGEHDVRRGGRPHFPDCSGERSSHDTLLQLTVVGAGIGVIALVHELMAQLIRRRSASGIVSSVSGALAFLASPRQPPLHFAAIRRSAAGFASRAGTNSICSPDSASPP